MVLLAPTSAEAGFTTVITTLPSTGRITPTEKAERSVQHLLPARAPCYMCCKDHRMQQQETHRARHDAAGRLRLRPIGGGLQLREGAVDRREARPRRHQLRQQLAVAHRHHVCEKAQPEMLSVLQLEKNWLCDS